MRRWLGVLAGVGVGVITTAACSYAIEHEFMELPAVMHPMVQGVPVEELRERFAAGDKQAVAIVKRVLDRAEPWRGIDGQWWLDRVSPVTPLGMWTTACPIHPERCQDFSDVSWRWSLDEPFRLYCPLCEQEGREYPYYPNPDYPDDGTGCYPTDEVWRRTHGPQWGREHPGIPWDRWDGRTHGYSSAGYAFFFRGKWHHEANMFIARTVLPALGEAWQVCKHVLPADDPRAERAEQFAYAVRIGLLTLARAHLGDEYLADIVGSEEQYRRLLADSYGDTPPRHFAGYVPYTLEDGITGNEEHPASTVNADIYCDGSQFGDAYADGWLRGFALVRDSYSEADEASGLVRVTECLLAAHPDDAARLAAAGGEYQLKYGKLDYHVRPYAMLGYHNLAGRQMASQFRLGRLLGDERIVRTVLDNFHYYLRNSFYGDGLDWEGSPAYTNTTWSTLSDLIKCSRGAPVVPPDHPWYSPQRKGLDLYRAQEMCNSLAKSVLSCLPNGHQIPWEDSHAATRPPVAVLQQCVRAGATIPADLADLFEITGEAGAQTVTMRDPATFPSFLLHNNRKVVFRMPRATHTDLLALDYTWPVGHWHYPPMTLLWFTRGQEVLTDLGYLGAMHQLTRQWIKRCPAHNCCVVRDEDGSHEVTHLLRGEPTGVLVDAGWLQVAEIAEQLPINLARLGADGVYGRTVAQIAYGDDASYVLDIMRVRGGAWHEWYLHADGETLSIEGCTLEALAPDVTLAEHWALPPGGGSVAWRHLRELRRGMTDGGWRATWSPLRTFDSGQERVRENLAFRCTMLAGGPTEIVAAMAPGQRYTDNRDLNARLPVLCARRRNGDGVDEFVAVHETIADTPALRSIDRLPAPQGIVAVRVDRGNEVDYLISRSWTSERAATIPTPDGELMFRADFAALTVAEDAVIRACVIGAGEVRLGDFALRAPEEFTGRLIAFDDDEDFLLIDSQTPWPDDDSLIGRWGMIRHEHGVSTCTIREVTRVPDGRVRIDLKYSPHLALNTVRATGVEGDHILLVQPHPAHPFVLENVPDRLGFLVYRRGEEGLESLGTLKGIADTYAYDNWGKRLGPGLPTIAVDGDVSRVKPGDDLIITRLRPGLDTVTVTPCVSVSRR